MIIPQGRAETILTRAITNTRGFAVTPIRNAYDNRLINEQFYEMERNQRSRTAGTSELSSPVEKIGNQGFLLGQNAPNPFSASTGIDYLLPADTQRGLLSLYDSKGQLIQQWSLDDSGHINLSTDGLTPGNYFYCLTADGLDLETKKMVVVK